jgi:hypothetical protein
MTGYTLGPEKRQAIPGAPGFTMRFNRAARKCVVFLGYPDRDTGPNAIICEGTGFLILYQGGFYLVTARHVAVTLGDVGWCVRVNKKDGTCHLIDADNVPWVFHPDNTVDVAVCGFGISAAQGYDFLYADGDILFLRKENETSDWVEVGDMCYTVGLWRLLEGKERNLPVVHTGNIARLAGEEKIPVRAPNKPEGRELVDGYLVEAQTLSGLSGSPVFIRPSIRLAMQGTRDSPDGEKEQLDLLAYREHVKLMGLWQAAWDAPAGEVLTAEHGRQNVVPVGMGIVVPASRIVEVLEMPILKGPRDAARRVRELHNIAEPQSTGAGVSGRSDRPSTDANPTHREDFNSLLGAAVKTPAQED